MNSGTPTTGSFMVGTSTGGGYFTPIEYLWGIYAPTASWEEDAPVLLESFYSIDYSEATLAGYRQILASAGGPAHVRADRVEAQGAIRASSSSRSGTRSRRTRTSSWRSSRTTHSIAIASTTPKRTRSIRSTDLLLVLRYTPRAVQAAEHAPADRRPVPESRCARREPPYRAEYLRSVRSSRPAAGPVPEARTGGVGSQRSFGGRCRPRFRRFPIERISTP